MNKTVAEQEDKLIDALCSPVVNFMEILNRIENGEALETLNNGKDPERYLEEFLHFYPQFRGTVMESIFIGYTAGFDAADNLYGFFFDMIEEKESSDETTTTETTK